ncbi:MAG: hypothetical protein MUQ10_19720 [Anaerolineae bacterium]|nr:hypothetical protein [Anaerolineae bacterium]
MATSIDGWIWKAVPNSNISHPWVSACQPHNTGEIGAALDWGEYRALFCPYEPVPGDILAFGSPYPQGPISLERMLSLGAHYEM